MKFIRYFLLILIVAAQVAYLVHSYGERTREIENAPRLVIKCNQYDPRDILRGDYFAIDTDFLQLDFNSPAWGKSLYWEADMLKDINSSLTAADAERLKFSPRVKAADDAVALASLEGKHVAVFWKQGEDGLHTAVHVEAIGTAADAPAEGEIRTVMEVCFKSHTDYSGDEGCVVDKVYASFYFIGEDNHYGSLRFYIPDGMTPNSFETPSDWNDKFSVELIYREDGTVLPHQLYVDGKPYLEAVQSLPRKQGGSRYNTSIYHHSYGGDVEVVPVEVGEGEDATGEDEKTGEQTEQPSEEVKPEEPAGEVQPQAVEEPKPEVQPQPAEQPQPEEPQPAEQPQPEEPQPAEQQPPAVEEPAPAPAPEAPAPEEDDEI